VTRLEDVPISKNVVAPLKKPSTTVSKKTAASKGLGALVIPSSDEEESQVLSPRWTPSSLSSTQEAHSRKRTKRIPVPTVESTEEWSTASNSFSPPRFGVTSGASSWRAQRAAANRRLSMTPSYQPMYTFSQSRLLFGSTATGDSAFSSLMSIRASLLAKNSSESWMAIATQLSTKEASQALAGIASCLLPITSLECGETMQSDDDFSEEGTSDSQAEEDNTFDCNSDCEENSAQDY